MILRALERGLTLRDFGTLTFGMILGLIITYNNEHIHGQGEEGSSSKPRIRQATQADFDRF